MLLRRILSTVRVLALGCGLLAAAAQAQTYAPSYAGEIDPPGRVGRVADVQGQVWLFDVEQGGWAAALRNRPVTSGDRLSTGPDARTEVRVGSTSFKLAAGSEVEFSRVDDAHLRVLVLRGSLAVRLRSREVAAEAELATPEAVLRPSRGGLYRIDREDDTTFASAWRGELRVDDAFGFDIDTGRRVQIWREGPSRQLRQRVLPVVDDSFAARVLREDREDERSAATAYVSTEMTGWEDLDRYGRWDQHPEYGAVWFPTAVAVDWVPYRHGRWEWVRPWGWTWVDDSAWGFAPFHYGRWVHWRSRWCWVPGTYVARPVFAPALVAWIDGPSAGIGIRIGGPSLSWVPLAPWEMYRPHYHSSSQYHERLHPGDHGRWRTPPHSAQQGGPVYFNQGTPKAVTVVPSEVLSRLRPPVSTPSAPLRDPRNVYIPADGRNGRDGRDDRRAPPAVRNPIGLPQQPGLPAPEARPPGPVVSPVVPVAPAPSSTVLPQVPPPAPLRPRDEARPPEVYPRDYRGRHAAPVVVPAPAVVAPAPLPPAAMRVPPAAMPVPPAAVQVPPAAVQVPPTAVQVPPAARAPVQSAPEAVSPRALPHILPPRPAMPAPAAPPEAKAQPRDKDRNADKEQPKEEGRARHGAERQAQPR